MVGDDISGNQNWIEYDESSTVQQSACIADIAWIDLINDAISTSK